MKEVSLQIKEARKRAGLTQAGLGELMGSSRPAIARIEAGNQAISITLLNRIAEALGCELRIELKPKEE